MKIAIGEAVGLWELIVDVGTLEVPSRILGGINQGCACIDCVEPEAVLNEYFGGEWRVCRLTLKIVQDGFPLWGRDDHKFGRSGTAEQVVLW